MLTGDVELIIAERNYWRSLEHDGWKLKAFSGKVTGQFYKVDTAGVIIIESSHLKFLGGVSYDVLKALHDFS